jgi:hypothetical protein
VSVPLEAVFPPLHPAMDATIAAQSSALSVRLIFIFSPPKQNLNGCLRM